MDMVVLQCPNCDEDMELDDSEFGLFSCSHCEGDFSYGEDGEVPSFASQVRFFMSAGMITGLTLLAIAVVWYLFLLPSLTGGLEDLVLIFPAGVCALAIPIIFISFYLRLRQLN